MQPVKKKVVIDIRNKKIQNYEEDIYNFCPDGNLWTGVLL